MQTALNWLVLALGEPRDLPGVYGPAVHVAYGGFPSGEICKITGQSMEQPMAFPGEFMLVSPLTEDKRGCVVVALGDRKW